MTNLYDKYKFYLSKSHTEQYDGISNNPFDIIKNQKITLYDLYKNTEFIFIIQRKIGKNIDNIDITLQPKKNQYIFEKYGHESKGDIIINFIYEEHPYIRKLQNDLHINFQIKKHEKNFKVFYFGGDIITVNFDSIYRVKSNYKMYQTNYDGEKVILKYKKMGLNEGDLYLIFYIMN
jgi:hypothetical protein